MNKRRQQRQPQRGAQQQGRGQRRQAAPANPNRRNPQR